MSIKKYVLVAFLSLGICTGNADVWGMKKSTIKQSEEIYNVEDNDQSLREQLIQYKGIHYGNVLCFVYDKKIIVLKNGSFLNTKFESANNVYLIDAKCLYKACGIEIKDELQEQYMGHTEYQFAALIDTLSNGNQVVVCDTRKRKLEFSSNKFSDVKKVISLFEPCTRCRELEWVKSQKYEFWFTAVDKAVKFGGQFKLDRLLRWKGDLFTEDGKYDKTEIKISIFPENNYLPYCLTDCYGENEQDVRCNNQKTGCCYKGYFCPKNDCIHSNDLKKRKSSKEITFPPLPSGTGKK